MAEKRLDPPTKEDYMTWRSNNVTRFFLQEIFNKRELLKEGIADGQTLGHDELISAIGRTQSLKDVVSYALFDFEVIDIQQEEDTE